MEPTGQQVCVLVQGPPRSALRALHLCFHLQAFTACLSNIFAPRRFTGEHTHPRQPC